MNNARRKMIDEALAKVQELKDALDEKVAEVVSMVETIRDEEQEAFDNLPESIQSGEKGDAIQEKIDALEEALSGLEEIQGADFDTIESSLETAKE